MKEVVEKQPKQKLSAEHLAGKLHLQLVRETAGLQLDIISMRALQQEFGDNALWVGKSGILTFATSLTESRRNVKHWIESTLETIERNLEVIRELEDLFAKKNEQDIKDLAEFFRDRYKQKV